MDMLRVAGDSQGDALAGLLEAITKVKVDPLLMVQGGTTVIKVYAAPSITMRGLLAERNLNFSHKSLGLSCMTSRLDKWFTPTC